MHFKHEPVSLCLPLIPKAAKQIVAPFVGIVTARNTDIGAPINSSNAGQALFKVSNRHRVRIYVQVPDLLPNLSSFIRRVCSSFAPLQNSQHEPWFCRCPGTLLNAALRGMNEVLSAPILQRGTDPLTVRYYCADKRRKETRGCYAQRGDVSGYE